MFTLYTYLCIIDLLTASLYILRHCLQFQLGVLRLSTRTWALVSSCTGGNDRLIGLYPIIADNEIHRAELSEFYHAPFYLNLQRTNYIYM